MSSGRDWTDGSDDLPPLPWLGVRECDGPVQPAALQTVHEDAKAGVAAEEVAAANSAARAVSETAEIACLSVTDSGDDDLTQMSCQPSSSVIS